MSKDIDVLERDNFINLLLKIIGSFSDKKENVTFSINGEWGVGKSWVINRLEKQLEVIKKGKDNKYLILHYNAWQYDYYAEPLVSIVSALVDSIDEKNHLLPQKVRDFFKKTLKMIGAGMFSVIGEVIKCATDMNVNQVYADICKKKKEFKEKKADSKSYDELYALGKEIIKIRNALTKQAEKLSIVFIVDELDRCIPEYSIKVLERLHHVTNGIPNMITIIVTDKSKLDKNIEKVFGFNDTEKYLEKFIDFELELNKGNISNEIIGKCDDLIKKFEQGYFPQNDTLEDFFKTMLNDVDVRKHENIIKKIAFAHDLLFSDYPAKDYLFLCLELFYAVVIDVIGGERYIDTLVSYREAYDDFAILNAPSLKSTPIIDVLNTKIKTAFRIIQKEIANNFHGFNYVICSKQSLYATLMFFIENIGKSFSKSKVVKIKNGNGFYEQAYIDKTINDIVEFIGLYKILK